MSILTTCKRKLKLCVFCVNSRFPVDWLQPLGFLVAVAVQCTIVAYFFLFVACMTCIGVESYIFAVSVTEDIKSLLKCMNRFSKPKKHQSKIKQQLFVYIRTHSTVKQLSDNCESIIPIIFEYHPKSKFPHRLIEDFTRLFQPMLTLLVIWSLITMCGTMLMVQAEIVRHCRLYP